MYLVFGGRAMDGPETDIENNKCHEKKGEHWYI
jgi:hypothetical protein